MTTDERPHGGIYLAAFLMGVVVGLTGWMVLLYIVPLFR